MIGFPEHLRRAIAGFADRSGLGAGFKWLGRRHWLFRLLIPIALISGAVGIVFWIEDGIERIGFDRQRRDWIDNAFGSDVPANQSAFCRGAFGFTRDYQPCWLQEKRGHALFYRAWYQGRQLSTVREQLIACFASAQQPQGVSWAAAAACAEADAPPAPIVRDPG